MNYLRHSPGPPPDRSPIANSISNKRHINLFTPYPGFYSPEVPFTSLISNRGVIYILLLHT